MLEFRHILKPNLSVLIKVVEVKKVGTNRELKGIIVNAEAFKPGAEYHCTVNEAELNSGFKVA